MSRPLTFFVLVLVCLTTTRAEDAASSGRLFQEKINAFHENQPGNNEVLKIVYFHASDNPPQAGYKERTNRILRDYSQFLHAGMAGHGFTSPAIPFDEDDAGQIKIHLVKGAGVSDDYQYTSGQRVKLEVKKALGDEIDFESDFIFILCGLCQKRGENDYFFHSPYYGEGGSNQIKGLCYAADCEVLDPLNLTVENGQIPFRYEEHYGTFKKSLARFNSWYLGGIAHELGHGLSLPHNGELPSERKALGNALMGGGNHTYGDDRWGGGNGTFLAFANALRLAAHPLFTQSDHQRFVEAKIDFEKLNFEAEGEALTTRGIITGSPTPLAIIAYSDPPKRDGYNAITWVAPVEKDGTFKVKIKRHPFTGLHDLRLNVVQMNGAVSNLKTRYKVNEKHEPDGEALNARFIVQPVVRKILSGDDAGALDLITQELDQPHDEKTLQLLTHLLNLRNPIEPISPIKHQKDHLFLSDAIWTKAEVGWGTPARNQYFRGNNSQDKLILELGGEFYLKGLYAHAPSNYTFSLGKNWKNFETVVGLQGGVGPVGRSQFTVIGDGKILAKSAILKGNETEWITVDVSGVTTLELKAKSTIEGNPQCWSIWGSPKVSR